MSGSTYLSLGKPEAVTVHINYGKSALAITPSKGKARSDDWQVCPIGATGSYRVNSGAAVEYVWSALGRKRFLIPVSFQRGSAIAAMADAQELPGRRNKPRPTYPTSPPRSA